ncbi:MAG: zinc finger domain protein [Segetibacter sp.]|nr:zinc finger domain protein [Segetibacter sp.]
MNLTEDQILALAPDEPSKKSGKDLANPNKWVSKGINEVALWGEAQGSGSKPYQTQVDINNIAFKCSCPSRKFPCKHGLGLLLLHARQPNLFATAEMPVWVNDWISKRAVREEKKVEKVDKPVDEAAQAKRLENREKKVADGIEELLLWIKDIVRNGIINLPEKGFAFWEQMAKRMVDAQAPGLAGMVRGLGQVGFFKDGWQTEFIDQLLNIYLLINGYKNKGNLSPTLHQDVRTWIGFTQNQDELKEDQGITDTWLVLAKQSSEDDNLTVEKYWLHGVETGQYALILHFLFRGQGSEISLTPGMYVQAELVFFPSVSPIRAIIKRQISTSAASPKKTFAHWKQIAENETRINVEIPFNYPRPYIIKQVTPVSYQNQWWLVDENNDLMQINQGFKNIWKLLAISGGNPVDAAIIGKENLYEPIGVWDNETYKSL